MTDPHPGASARPWHFAGDGYAATLLDAAGDRLILDEALLEPDALLVVEAVNDYDRLRAIEAAARTVAADHLANGHREPCPLCVVLALG